jgi:hemerythrin
MSQAKRLEWKDEYSVKVVEIDNQHKKIIALINQLYEAMIKNDMEATVIDILSEMQDYANNHFATEEKMFVECEYEDAVAHTKTHEAYRERVTTFIHILDETPEDAVTEYMLSLLSFLEDWWIGHILHSDQEYVDCFVKHGLS